MASFSTRELYGGAITVELPSDYIDASTIRQIPSHQEVFLSPTTLTSLIIELNTRLASPTDSLAASTHFTDPIALPDTSTIASTTPATLSRPSLAGCPAYVVRGSIGTHERHAPSATEVASTLLLVRIERKATDVCVRVNVPTKELGAEQAAVEEGLAGEIVERVLASLDVKDWSLFVD